MKVCVIGLGRIGLPMAAVCADAGHDVVGVDNNDAAIRAVAEGKPYFNEPVLEELMKKHAKTGKLKATKDAAAAIAASDVIVVTIGTSVGANGEPLLDNAFSVARGIGDALAANKQKGKLIVFKPTLPLGTTRKLVAEIEARSGLKCGSENESGSERGNGFFAAFSPERIVEGKAVEEMRSLPKVIGGMNAESAARARAFYETIGGEIVVVEKPEAAELVKLIDNSFRSTMFAFANDVALLCENWGLNASEVIDAANHGYKRNRVAKPSCGVSGYCLTKDPYYLEVGFADVSRRRGFNSLWKHGRETNEYMPLHTLELLEQALAARKRALRGARVVVCGVSFKENVDDVRQSHGLFMAEELRRRGAEVSVWDPRAERVDFPRKASAGDAFAGADAVLFTVPHDEFKAIAADAAKFDALVESMRTPVVIDGWSLFLFLRGRAGVEYKCVGVG